MVDIIVLQARMAEAIAKGNIAGIEAIAQEIVKSKGDRAKVEAEQLRKEAEALAGEREKLSKAIHDAVRTLKLDKAMKDVKAWGFTYKVDKANPAELDVSYKAVSLSVQTVKAKTSKGGATGKSKVEYGISLQEIVDKFGTDAEKANIASAPNNSRAWQLKVVVKKRAIAEGKLAPAK